jgi:hypothetical protein
MPCRRDAPWTGMPPTKNSGKKSRRIKSDQTLSNLTTPHSAESKDHNLERRIRVLIIPEQS